MTIARLLDSARVNPDLTRLLRTGVLILLGLCIGTGAVISDVYFHRGVETSADFPYVTQVSGRELATNVDLMAFSPGLFEPVADRLKTSGFSAVRQVFSWSAIEPVNGEFAWVDYDRVVNALFSRGIQIVAVLARSPDWARSPEAIGFADAPPVNSGDYTDFVQRVVERYKGKVQFVQIWDLPNRADYWGGVAATSAQYSDLLANASNAARTAEAEIKVVLAEFDPIADGKLGADLRFLERIYDLRRSAFFDVVAARIDGGSASPYDRGVDGDRQNFSRAVLFRELLVEKGDIGKPVWLTHFGWQQHDGGAVSAQEQADFTIGGIRRARAEWPWAGMLFAWAFVPEELRNQASGRAVMNSDLSDTTISAALKTYGTGAEAAQAGTGFVPMESKPIAYDGAWSDQHLEGVVFKTTSETTASATLHFRGTGVLAKLRQSREAGPVRATLDGKPLPGWPSDGDASIINLRVQFSQAESVWYSLASGLTDGPHELALTLGGTGKLTIGGILVVRDPPLVWPVGLLLTTAFLLIVLALRELSYIAAIRAGYLQRRRGVELRPPLPHLPDWRPARRA